MRSLKIPTQKLWELLNLINHVLALGMLFSGIFRSSFRDPGSVYIILHVLGEGNSSADFLAKAGFSNLYRSCTDLTLLQVSVGHLYFVSRCCWCGLPAALVGPNLLYQEKEDCSRPQNKSKEEKKKTKYLSHTKNEVQEKPR
jgi:hypothetical protein